MNATDFLEDKRTADEFLNAPDDLSQVGKDPADQAALADVAAERAGRPLESYNAAVPPSLNPDYDIVRETKGNLPLALAGRAVGEAQKLIEPIAAPALRTAEWAYSPITAIMRKRGKLPAIEAGKPMAPLPHLTKEELDAATPAERMLYAATDPIVSMAEGLTTPGNLAMLPFAEMKPVQAAYGVGAAASIPESLQRIAESKNPEELISASSKLGIDLGMTGLITHSITKEGAPNASRVTSSEGIPQPEVRASVGQEASLRQQGQAAIAQAPVAKEAQVSLSDEHSKLLAPHWVDDVHEFGNLGEGRVMVADHATGKVVVDPVEFGKFVDQDLKGLSPKEKAAAVKSKFDHEDIHLKTDPEDAEPYWNSLSPVEQAIYKRNYLRGADVEETPRNLGFEAIRNHIERASGMTRDDFVGLALKERWTAKTLDGLANIVGKIRRLKDSELNASQKAILDKVMGNIDAAKNAVPAQQTADDESKYVEGPFSRRQPEPDVEEGKVRLYRGHEGDRGGAYWTKDRPYAESHGSQLEAVDVPEHLLPDYSMRKQGSGSPGTFKLPEDLTKNSRDLPSDGAPVHDLGPASRRNADELLKLKPGDTTVDDVVNLPDEEAMKFFTGNQKRGNATQHDAVLAGMKLGVDRVPELMRMRDQMHKVGMQKLEKSFGPGGDGKAPAEMAKVIWLNGAIEGAARKGPNYESVVTRRRELADNPAARRNKGKAGEQEDFLKGISPSGVPGEEWGSRPEHATAGAVGAREVPPEQKVFPKDMTFEFKQYGAKSLPFREITASEAKNPAELTRFLTADARKGGSDLPVSMSKRLTALFDKTDGSVHLVSTYQGDGIARMVDPDIAGKERNSRPIDDLLHRYQPIASVLLAEPRQGFHQKFLSMSDFRDNFSNEAKEMLREHGTGFTGIPMTEVGKTSASQPAYDLPDERIAKPGGGPRLQQGVTGFRYPSEREPNLPRPTTGEMQAFHDFFGDTPPSDLLMFSRRVEREAAKAPRAMINGLRKLVRMERAQTRGLSEGEAITRVLDNLYENFNSSETRSEFVQKTLEQGRYGAPAEVPPRGAPRETGARELSTIRDVAPTTVRGVQGPRPQTPEPARTPVEPVKKLTPEEQAFVDAEAQKHHPPQFKVSPETTLGKQVLETTVPKQRYNIGKSKTIEGNEIPDDPQAGKEESAVDKGRYIETLRGWLKSQEAKTAPDKLVKEAKEALADALLDYEDTQGQPYEEAPDAQQEFFPSREVESYFPEEAEAPTESLKAQKKVLAKAEGNKAQLDFWNKQGPAARRNAETAMSKLKDYLARTRISVSKAGSLADQLNRLKTSESADAGLAYPVIKAAIKLIPEADREKLWHYTEEMQVIGKSAEKLTDAQQMMYDTFIEPLMEDNARMYRDLERAGVPAQENTYLGRVVQDTHSLYSRLARGTKRRVAEGNVLGTSASFLKRRVFKALEDSEGNRQLVAIVGKGDNARIISYTKGKAELMGETPPSKVKAQPLTASQIRSQRLVDVGRLTEMHQLNKIQDKLDAQLNNVMQRPEGPGKKEAMDAVQARIDDLQSKYVALEEKYPVPMVETPRLWTDKSGKMWKITDATVKEIEGNTNTRYYKEPMSAIITQNLKLKQLHRSAEFLNDLKNSPDFKSVSRPAGGSGARNAPADWKQVSLRPFQGLLIEPRTAEVLDQFHQEMKGPQDSLKTMHKILGFIKEAIFTANPFMHEPNLLEHWFVGRGAEWLKPGGYARLVKSGAEALNDTLTRSRFRDQALRAGAPLMNQMKDMHTKVLDLLGKEMEQNPSLARQIARKMGQVNPLRMIRAFGDTLTWGTNELLTLQLIHETMDRTGLSLEDTIKEVGKHMIDYRVPPRVLNSQLVSHVMRNPLLSLWGHYAYGRLKSYGEMGKEIFSPNSKMQDRVDGLGRVAAIGFLMYAMHPAVDYVINKIMGTKGYKTRRAGPTTVPQAAVDVATGKRSLSQGLQTALMPSPAWTIPGQLMFNRDFRSGLPIYDRRLGFDTAKDIGSFAANQLSPIQEAGKIFGGSKSAKEYGLGIMGVTHTQADSSMSQFSRMADAWMKNNPSEKIRDAYKNRSQDVFAQSEYQKLRSAVVRSDHSAGQLMVKELLKTRTPDEVEQRIQAWKDSPFTGTKDSDKKLMEEMTPQQWDLWYQAAQERLDIAEGMERHLVEYLVEQSK